MSRNRTYLPLVVGLLALLMGAPAVAQDLRDLQLFAPADVTPYGNGPQAPQGFFFQYDYLRWAISSPDVTSVGHPGLTRTVFHTRSDVEIQSNSVDTGDLSAEYVNGERFEFGHIVGHWGWTASIFNLHNQSQRFWDSNVDIVFDDIAFGPGGFSYLEGWVADMIGYDGDPQYVFSATPVDLPVTFDALMVTNKTKLWNAELMGIYRLHATHHGGNIEIFGGVRYLQIDDQFNVDARGEDTEEPADIPANSRFEYDLGEDGTGELETPIATGNVFADSYWNTRVMNRIVGPQVGARWSRIFGRWTLSTEGRFFAGFNSQSIRQSGVIGTSLDAGVPFFQDATATPPPTAEQYPYVPLLRQPLGFNHSAHLNEFSPGAELRAELKFQLTRAVFVKAGWTGTWMAGIARASNIVDYTISERSILGIDAGANREDLFVQGVNIGVTVNR